MAIDYKYGVTDMFENKMQTFGILPHEVSISSKVIDMCLLRETKAKYVLRSIVKDNSIEQREKLLGARVFSVVGTHSNVIAVDFSAEYPSIIEAFNISPETYRGYVEQSELCNYYHIHYFDSKCMDRPFDAYFCKDDKGIIPTMIKKWKALRKVYKGKMEDAIAKCELENVIRKWERSQYNTKRNTNAIYGWMGFEGSRLYNENCTQATAILGRIASEVFIDSLPELDVGYGKGYKLVVSDTDSCYVLGHGKSKDELFDEGTKIRSAMTEIVNKKLREIRVGSREDEVILDLGFQGIYEWLLVTASKNYAYLTLYDEKRGWVQDFDIAFGIKGISAIRSDTSKIEKECVRTILIMLAKKVSLDDIECYIQSIKTKFDGREYLLLDLAYPAQLKNRLMWSKKSGWIGVGYKVATAMLKAVVYSNTHLETEYSLGDKPRRLPVKLPRMKTLHGQLSLDRVTTYPSFFEYKGTVNVKGKRVKGKTWRVTDIAFSEGVVLPKYILEHVDYDAIWVRLEKKLRRILDIAVNGRDTRYKEVN
jgi:DNA polymerase elongation subunit (family B)